MPLGYVYNEAKGNLVPTYPVGFPLHLAAASRVVGLNYATLLVNLSLVVAMGVLIFLFSRRLGLPVGWSLAAVVILSLCPLYLFYAIQTMSDLAATVWTTAALYFGLRTRDNSRWGYFAGLATGVAVLIRPTNLLVLVPLGVALQASWRNYFHVAVGGLPAAAFLAYFNKVTYGALFATGYGDLGKLLQPSYALHNGPRFVFWLVVLLTPFVTLPAFLIFRFPTLRRHAVLLSTWVAAFAGFYLFYYHSGETWWYSRFILPGFPSVLLAGLLVLHELCHMSSLSALSRWVKWPGLILIAATEIVLAGKLNLSQFKHGELTYSLAASWMKAHVPADSIVLQMQTSGSFTFYTDFALVRWDLITPAGWDALRDAARKTHRPIYAALFDFENVDALKKRVPGPWKPVEHFRGFYVWRLEMSPEAGQRP